MPLEGQRSRHSVAYLPQLPQQGLNTISDDYSDGQATTCQRMDLAAAAGPVGLLGLQSSWLTRAGETQRYETDDCTTAVSGPTRQS